MVPLVKAVQQQQIEIEQIKSGKPKTKPAQPEPEIPPARAGDRVLLFAIGGLALLMFAGMGLLLVNTRRELRALRKILKRTK